MPGPDKFRHRHRQTSCGLFEPYVRPKKPRKMADPVPATTIDTAPSTASDVVSSAAAGASNDDDFTPEGRTATELDPAIQLRLNHAISKLKADDFEGAADLLSDLLRES